MHTHARTCTTPPGPCPQPPLSPPTPQTHTRQVHVPEGLTALDLDVIKMTAQFVARNGKAFLTGLAQREASNPQVRARVWRDLGAGGKGPGGGVVALLGGW